jgi:(p)ppGpp synthase/HD superfamily hydrolase
VQLFTTWHSWRQAEPGLRDQLTADTVARLHEAVDFATVRHGDQQRPTGAPYTDHLLEALEVLVRGAGVTSPDILCAAVLHDVVEDTPCTLDELAGRFSPRIAELVGWVTIPEPGPGQDRASVKEDYLRGLRWAPHDAILVKLADRASNAQTLRNLPPARQRAYYAQTVEHIVPLAAEEPWFAAWYRDWAAEFADLAEPAPESGLGDASFPAPTEPSQEMPSHASRPSG